MKKHPDIREVSQNEFRYDFRKGPREISAGTVITGLKAIMHVNTVNTVPAESHEDLSENRTEIRFAKPPFYFRKNLK